jgi:hypothetical protein
MNHNAPTVPVLANLFKELGYSNPMESPALATPVLKGSPANVMLFWGCANVCSSNVCSFGGLVFEGVSFEGVLVF